jgi:septal ring factor EnvC (AmiA/AmiB activator)
MKKLLFFALAVGLLSSCNYKSAAYKELERRSDSIMTAKIEQERDLNDYLDIVNSVEENFTKIKAAQNYVNAGAQGEQLGGDLRERLTADMALIQEILQKNKDKIAELENKNSSLANELQRSLKALKGSISEKEAMIAQLQEELLKKDIQIGELTTKVTGLTEDVGLLETARLQNEAQIKAQDSLLNTAWYVAKSKRDLKEAKIIESSGFLGLGSKKVLQQDFDKAGFTTIDVRETTRITVSSSDPKLMTKHAENTYSIQKGDGTSIIVIKSPDFWKVSRYLVVQL